MKDITDEDKMKNALSVISEIRIKEVTIKEYKKINEMNDLNIHFFTDKGSAYISIMKNGLILSDSTINYNNPKKNEGTWQTYRIIGNYDYQKMKDILRK